MYIEAEETMAPTLDTIIQPSAWAKRPFWVDEIQKVVFGVVALNFELPQKLSFIYKIPGGGSGPGRAGLPPPGRRLLFCIYLVHLVYDIFVHIDIWIYLEW